jgi:hypothetical protein
MSYIEQGVCLGSVQCAISGNPRSLECMPLPGIQSFEPDLRLEAYGSKRIDIEDILCGIQSLWLHPYTICQQHDDSVCRFLFTISFPLSHPFLICSSTSYIHFPSHAHSDSCSCVPGGWVVLPAPLPRPPARQADALSCRIGV